MKKRLLLVALLVMAASALFAADYVVASVKGKVQYESAPGVWKDVKVGQKLSASTNLNTSLNASITVELDGESFTIKAMQKGAIDSLIASNSGSKGIKKGSINSTSVASKSDGSTKGVATASSRASDAKEDFEWDEE